MPSLTITQGVTHAYIAFSNPADLLQGNYNLWHGENTHAPATSVAQMRANFPADTKMLISIGGWGWTSDFAPAAATPEGRANFATHVGNMIRQSGADGVDIDWEYPCGGGMDWKQVPDYTRAGEIETFPALLEAIRTEIGSEKLLTIAAPGKESDLTCFTAETVPRIAKSLDMVNIMTYDLLNRRDSYAAHHSSLVDSEASVQRYLDRGLPADKANLGFAFYAKWVMTEPGCETGGLGCRLIPGEDENGKDTLKSGVLTFETSNMSPAPLPIDIPFSYSGMCGPEQNSTCGEGSCCSSSGYCGTSPEHCAMGCFKGYGSGCQGPDIAESWKTAQANAVLDNAAGGAYYHDKAQGIFWTWDTTDYIRAKIERIAKTKGLGGVFAWSLAQDSFDNSHVIAMKDGMAGHVVPAASAVSAPVASHSIAPAIVEETNEEAGEYRILPYDPKPAAPWPGYNPLIAEPEGRNSRPQKTGDVGTLLVYTRPQTTGGPQVSKVDKNFAIRSAPSAMALVGLVAAACWLL